MRVIGGRSRGRRLGARLPAGLRPTSDRVREAVFDILGSMGVVEGATVVDLFCGSGALGLEALSRGAATVTFVDRDERALQAVRTNLAKVGLPREQARLVRASLPQWLETQAETEGFYDLALCDPPYRFTSWSRLLAALRAQVVVLESDGDVSLPAPWVMTKCRRYGGTLVTVARRTTPPDSATVTSS